MLPKGTFTYDVICFLGIFDLLTYHNKIIYYISLFSKIRCSLTYLKIWRHMWMLPNKPHLTSFFNPFTPIFAPKMQMRQMSVFDFDFPNSLTYHIQLRRCYLHNRPHCHSGNLWKYIWRLNKWIQLFHCIFDRHLCSLCFHQSRHHNHCHDHISRVCWYTDRFHI